MRTSGGADAGGRMAGGHAVGFPSSRCEGMAQGPSRGQRVAGLVPGFPPHLGPFRARPMPCFPRIPNVAAYLMDIRPGPYHKGSRITRPEGEGVHTLMVPGCRPEPAIGGDARSGPGMTGSRFAEILRYAQDDRNRTLRMKMAGVRKFRKTFGEDPPPEWGRSWMFLGKV